MKHLTFLGALLSGFRAGQLMVGLVLGKGQGAQGSSRTHSTTVQGGLQG